MRDHIERILGRIRPYMELHGGNVELVDVDEAAGRVYVRLQGRCADCPLSQITLKAGIEATLKEEIPGVKEVIEVTESSCDD